MKTKIAHVAMMFNAAFFGAFLFIAVAIIPFWQSIENHEIINWFNNYFWRLPLVMIPLNLLSFGAIIWGTFLHRGAGPRRGLWIASTICLFLCSMTYPVFFDGANRALANNSMMSEVNEILAQWSIWHYIRTFFSLSALLFLSIIVFTKQ